MERNARADNPILKVGDVVYESSGSHQTPARIIEVIESHSHTYYKIHFKENEILKKVILPDYRLKLTP